MEPKEPKLLPPPPVEKRDDPPARPPLVGAGAPGVVLDVVLAAPKGFDPPADPNPPNPLEGGAAVGVVDIPSEGVPGAPPLGVAVEPKADPKAPPPPPPEPPNIGLAGVEAGVVEPSPPCCPAGAAPNAPPPNALPPPNAPPPPKIDPPLPPPKAEVGAGVPAGVVLPGAAPEGVAGGCPKILGGAPVDALLLLLVLSAFPEPPNAPKPEPPPPNADILYLSDQHLN